MRSGPPPWPPLCRPLHGSSPLCAAPPSGSRPPAPQDPASSLPHLTHCQPHPNHTFPCSLLQGRCHVSPDSPGAVLSPPSSAHLQGGVCRASSPPASYPPPGTLSSPGSIQPPQHLQLLPTDQGHWQLASGFSSSREGGKAGSQSRAPRISQINLSPSRALFAVNGRGGGGSEEVQRAISTATCSEGAPSTGNPDFVRPHSPTLRNKVHICAHVVNHAVQGNVFYSCNPK